MNKSELLKSGYKEFPPLEWQMSNWNCQKRIDDVYDVKYFINVYYYKSQNAYEAGIQLYKGKLTLNVEIFNITSIKELEEFVEDLWVKMEFDYDHHNGR